MIEEMVVGVIIGIAAHQTDRLIKPGWPIYFDRLSRYSIGYPACILATLLILARINPAARRDCGTAMVIGGVAVGAGVAAGMIFDEVTR